MGIITGGSTAVAFALFAISVLCALYYEQWTFDTDLRRIEYRHGLLICHRSRSFDFADVASLELEMFEHGGIGNKSIRGSFATPRQFVKLRLRMQDGSHIGVLTQRVRSHVNWNQLVERLSAHCGVPLARDEDDMQQSASAPPQ